MKTPTLKVEEKELLLRVLGDAVSASLMNAVAYKNIRRRTEQLECDKHAKKLRNLSRKLSIILK